MATPRHVSLQPPLRRALRSSPPLPSRPCSPGWHDPGTVPGSASRLAGPQVRTRGCPHGARARRRLRARSRPLAPALLLVRCHFHGKPFTRHFSPHWYSRRALAVLAHRLLKEILRRSVAGVTFQPAPSRFPKIAGQQPGLAGGGAGSATSQLPAVPPWDRAARPAVAAGRGELAALRH